MFVGVQGLRLSLDVQVPSEKADCVGLELVNMVLSEIIIHEGDPKAKAKDHDYYGEFEIA